MIRPSIRFATFTMCLVAGATGVALAATGPRQYYSPWQHNPIEGYAYRYYYYRASRDGEYRRQVCVHSPAGPAGLLLFDRTAEKARLAALQRATAAEEELRKVRETMSTIKNVVTIRNLTKAQGAGINYSLRWQRYDGAWTDWEKFTVANDAAKWHALVGGINCQCEFDHIAGDDGYTGKS